MMKILEKIKTALRNRDGGTYIKTAFIVMGIAMILSVVMFYVETLSVMRYTKNNIELVLDGFLAKNSIAIYDSLRQGNSEAVRRTLVDSTEFDEMFIGQFENAAVESGKIVKYNGDDVLFSISIPEVNLTDSALKIEATYTITIPVRFAGKLLYDINSEITVESNYVSKTE